MSAQEIARLEAEQAADTRRMYREVYGPLLPRVRERRSFWVWLISVLPLLLLVGASLAETIVFDQYGRVIAQFPWPSGYIYYIVQPIPYPPTYDPHIKGIATPTPCPR